MTTVLYLSFAVISLLLFRGAITNDVLGNFSVLQNAKGNPFLETMIIQMAFSVVLFCHIPFVFFSGKEACLIIVDEI